MELNEITDGLPEPVRKAWERSLAGGRAALTRRTMLRAAALTAGAGTLAACGIQPARTTGTGDSVANAAEDRSESDKEVNFSNWPLYVDTDENDTEKHGTLEAFTEATGIKVKYTEDVNDNVEFFGKVKPQLAMRPGHRPRRHGAHRLDGRPADPARLGAEAQPVQHHHGHHQHRVALPRPRLGPGPPVQLPLKYGIQVVIAYNAKATKGKPVTSVSQLLDDPELKGRVTFLSEMRDTIGMTLLDMDKDPAKFTADDYAAAVARLQKGVDSKQIRKFTGNDYGQELSSGDIAACLAWGGDLIQLKADNPDIEFVIPEKGYVSSTDNMVIPARAQHKANAERLIDFYYRPETAARLTAGIGFVSAVTGMKEALAALDPDTAANPLVVPTPEMAAKVHVFRSLNEAEESDFEEKFSKLIGA